MRGRIGIYPKTAADALRDWDEERLPVHTIEMGGIGPGYEQCIQLLVFELIRDGLGKPLPDKAAFSTWGDAAVDRLNKYLGFSGGQVGAAKALAFMFLRDGYEETMFAFPQERRILARKTFPQVPA